MAICLYDGKRIIPAPLVTIEKSYNTTGDRQKVGTTFTIQLRGQIHAIKGSPDESGSFYSGSLYPPDQREESTYVVPDVDNDTKISYILRKQEALRELFSDDGKQFEIQSFDGSSPLKCNPIIESISFQEGLWVDVCDYTITMSANQMTNFVNGNYEDDFKIDGDDVYIESANESWSIETEESPIDVDNPRRYLISHTVSAKGQRVYDDTGEVQDEAWEMARLYVSSRLGFDINIINDSEFPTNVTDAVSVTTVYNHVRSENIDELDGTCSVTEAWILAPDSASETFEINSVRDAQSGYTNVTVTGTIQGLEERDEELGLSVSKYENAETKWDTVSGQIFTRAQSYTGLTLNPTARSWTIGRNPLTGSISYTYEYRNGPTNYITGTIFESINVTDSWDVDVFAAIPVIGRIAGPVLQSIGTKREKIRTLSIEFTISADDFAPGSAVAAYNSNPFDTSPQAGDIQSIVDSIKPIATNVFVSNQNKNWDISSLKGTYIVEWVYGD